MPSVTTYRRWSRKLAESLGCTIEAEQLIHGRAWFVSGPDCVYDQYHRAGQGLTYTRQDPLDGDHYCDSWAEVYHSLRIYCKDLALNALGIPSEMTNRIFCDDDQGLGAAWSALLHDGDTGRDAALVLADWHEEYGDPEAAACIRGAFTYITDAEVA